MSTTGCAYATGNDCSKLRSKPSFVRHLTSKLLNSNTYYGNSIGILYDTLSSTPSTGMLLSECWQNSKGNRRV
ncbi:hypothetical protein H6H01_26985 [Nostoc calcicola FACHB-3891]|nr:hypothetical protein [Nostoc calcicola FACHB-3891]